MKTYELQFYYMQGEDFAYLLGKTDSLSEALRMWARRMQRNVNDALQLADLFRYKDVDCDADTHMIIFSGDESVLDEAVKQEILTVCEWDDGEREEE